MIRQSTKLFMNGRSQAVRLPKEGRFEGNEVYIYKDKKTGNLENFFHLMDEINSSELPMIERDNDLLKDKVLF